MEKHTGGEGKSSSSDNHHFFKILLGNFKKRLLIPQGFIKQFTQSHTSKQAILEGPSGSCWHVKVKLSASAMYFEDGWEAFSRDHSLQENDFLLFKYDGNMQFSVKIFDTSACQREDTFSARPFQESTFCGGRKTCSCPPRGFTKARYDTTSKNDVDLSHLSQPLQKKRKSYLKSKQRDKIPSSSKQERRMIAVERREAAYSFTSDFHFFITRLRMSNVVKPFNLTIPVFFGRLHLSPRTRMMKLQDVEGNTWRVNCYVRESQYALCGGWKAFVDENGLKVGDYLVFELLDDCVMRFHIF